MDTLDKYFRNLTRQAFARYGFAYAEVIARWPEIVGEDLARVSRPDRIRWPRGAAAAEKSGGTLLVGAAPGRALELQYEVPRIIERVNRFYGHGAIAAVKVTTLARPPPSPPKPPPVSTNPVPVQLVAPISDDRLKAALTQLGASVAVRAQTSPHGK